MSLWAPVTVLELSDSGLTRERWIFSLTGNRLVLNRYYYERRRSSSQEFKVFKFYDSFLQEAYGDWQWLTEKEIPWDEDIQSRALIELMNRLQVVKVSE